MYPERAAARRQIRRVGVFPCASCRHWKMARTRCPPAAAGDPLFRRLRHQFAARDEAAPHDDQQRARLPQATFPSPPPDRPPHGQRQARPRRACTTSSSTFRRTSTGSCLISADFLWLDERLYRMELAHLFKELFMSWRTNAVTAERSRNAPPRRAPACQWNP